MSENLISVISIIGEHNHDVFEENSSQVKKNMSSLNYSYEYSTKQTDNYNISIKT